MPPGGKAEKRWKHVRRLGRGGQTAASPARSTQPRIRARSDAPKQDFYHAEYP